MESVLQRVAPVFRGALARAGAFVFLFACLVPFLRPSFADDMRSISVARAFATAAPQLAGITPERVRDIARAELVLGVQATPVATPWINTDAKPRTSD